MTTDQPRLFDIAPIRDYGCTCVDCGDDTEAYMVRDDVWPIGKLDGWLCVGCVETRIGRKLTPADFTDCAMNRWAGTPRLRARLTGSECAS